MTGEIEGTDFVAKFTTHPKGAKLKGDAELEMDSETFELELFGTKKAGKS